MELKKHITEQETIKKIQEAVPEILELKTKTITISQFGTDHWSLFVYIETRAVDFKGVLDKNHLRIRKEVDTAGRIPLGQRPEHSWKPEWGTRLKGFEIDKDLRLPHHDDLDCFDDLENAKLIENLGTGLNPAAKLTKKGILIASKLRNHKANRGCFANFDYKKR